MQKKGDYKMSWAKLTPLTEPVSKGCLNCGTNHVVAPMDMLIAVGFGDARVTKDGETIYSELDKQGQCPCECTLDKQL